MEATQYEPWLLLVGDDPAVVTLVSRALHEVGWQVRPCLQLTTVCEQVANECPSAVLIDTHLPFPASGWRVVQALREHESTREVPVIVCSDHTRELEEKEGWLLEQRIGVLSKPIELEDLYDGVEEYHPSRRNRTRSTVQQPGTAPSFSRPSAAVDGSGPAPESSVPQHSVLRG